MKKLTYILLTLLVLSACTGTSRHPQLVAADSLLLSRPDSALTLLRSMSFSSTSDRMYYYLLLADACNKCYDTLPSDTILQEVAAYYDRHGNPNEQVRAHYLLGCAYRDLGEAPRALDYFHQAIDCADTTSKDCNYSILCRIHSQAAGIFRKQYMPEEAIKELDEAIRCSERTKDTLTSLYCYENKLLSFYQAGEYDSVLINTKQVFKKYWSLGFYNRAACCLSPAIFVLIKQHELQEAKKYINIYEEYSEREESNKNNLQGMYYSYLGFYHLYSHRLDSAVFYFNRQLGYKERLNNRVLAYHGLFDAYQKANQKDSALKYAFLYNEANDSSNIFESAEKLQRMQAMYDYSRHQEAARKAEQKAERTRTLLFVLLAAGVIVIAVGTLLYLQYRNRKRAEIQQLTNDYGRALMEFNKQNAELERLKQEDSSLIEEKQQEVEELKEKLKKYQSALQTSNASHQVSDFTDSDIVSVFRKKAKGGPKVTLPTEEEWMRLVSLFSQSVPLAFSAMGRDVVLSANEMRVCVLLLSGFKIADIAILLDCSPQSVTNIKARANNKLFAENSAATLEKNLMKTVGLPQT